MRETVCKLDQNADAIFSLLLWGLALQIRGRLSIGGIFCLSRTDVTILCILLCGRIASNLDVLSFKSIYIAFVQWE